MVELIITEKPSAAKKIAEGLSSKPNTKKEGTVTYYELEREGKKILVVSAVGHLFSVAEKNKTFKYPSFDIEWVPSNKVSKNASYSKKYLDVIKKISKQADSFTVACDYDVEGEVIGLNVLRYACKQKDGYRMKFSTLVKEDVKKSYDNKLSNIDWGQAKAGETRHFLDWLYGINISRALTTAIKTAGSFKIMSSGRVQGPALKIIYDREMEIKDFKPEPFWEIRSLMDKDVEAKYAEGKVWEENKAKKIYDDTKDVKESFVKEVKENEFGQAPPNPFDLGGLQAEAYKVFKIAPKKTLQLAQSLYLKGLTSYPRTSSQVLPPEINYKKILTNLAINKNYTELASKLLKKGSLRPNNGKKTDPAHPAIYPTGQRGSVSGEEAKLYDLVVKRFMSTFAESAIRTTTTMIFDINKYDFKASGSRTIKKGWHSFYEPYVKLKEQVMPNWNEKDKVIVKEVFLDAKETEPPKRYTPASLIKELEKRNLGTKATRADIVDSLFERGYLHEKSIEATELGIRLVNILKKYSPEIVDEEMTRHFEEEMENIRNKKSTPEQVLDKAKAELIKILDKFKKQEKLIGSELIVANKETNDALTTVGKCVNCGEGNLKIRKGKFGSFVACDKYPDCKTTFSLPKGVMIKPTDKKSVTGYPLVEVITKGKRPQLISLNPKDNIPEDKKELVDKLEKEGYVDKESGIEMKLRYGFYGPFLAAKNYPKEKKILNLDQIKKS